MLTLILVVAVGLLFYLAVRPKRFGLKEAEASLECVEEYIKSPEQAVAVVSAVMATVVGALGYQNTVADGVAAESARLESAKGVRRDRIARNTETIEALQFQIAVLRNEIARRDNRVTEIARIAQLFNARK